MMIDEVLAGNATFAAAGGFEGLPMLPRQQLLVIGCADPRVDPERILGLALGEAAVVRNIGGRVTRPTLAVLAGLAMVGRLSSTSSVAPIAAVPARRGLDVVVLHHTDCGILRLADHPVELAGFLGVDPGDLPAMAVTDPVAAVTRDVATVRSTMTAPGIRVWGLVYDVVTGRVELVVAPEQVSA